MEQVAGKYKHNHVNNYITSKWIKHSYPTETAWLDAKQDQTTRWPPETYFAEIKHRRVEEMYWANTKYKKPWPV